MLSRSARFVLVFVLLLQAGAAAAAGVAPAPGLYLRGQLGYAWPGFSDLDAEVQEEANLLGSATLSLDWEEMPGAPALGGEIGYAFTPVFSLGIGVGYQKSTRDHFADVFLTDGVTLLTGTITQTLEASLLSVMLTPTLWVPSAPGLHFGAQLGIGRGSFDRTENDDVSASDGTFIVGTFREEFDQTEFTGGLFAGYDVSLSPGLALSTRAGYQFGGFSDMEGTLTADGVTELGPFSGSEPAQLTNSSGAPLEISFNGWNLGLGLVYRFSAGR